MTADQWMAVGTVLVLAALALLILRQSFSGPSLPAGNVSGFFPLSP